MTDVGLGLLAIRIINLVLTVSSEFNGKKTVVCPLFTSILGCNAFNQSFVLEYFSSINYP